MMLGATAAAFVAAPLAVIAFAMADLAKGRAKLPRVRVFLFVLQYGINDSVEILLSPVLWLIAGCGRRLDGAASIARHQRLQRWSLLVLARRAEALLGLRLDVDATQLRAFDNAPFIIISRHVSLFDASLPSLVTAQAGIDVRGVIMAELLADPGFDLLYGRLGSVFIPRENGPESRALIERIGTSLTGSTAIALFPEGRLFRPELLARIMTSLATKDPDRATRLASLQHSLPPRPGGFLSLLAAAPEVDVVTVNHRGLEPFARVADLIRDVPLSEPIAVEIRRTNRTDIPTDFVGQMLWLDAEWVRMDAWVDEAAR
jgi:1-acyl-sn-glycerol-3-phosphate acyltransferase